MKNSSWGLCSHALKPPKLFPCFSPVVITVFVISHSRETRLLAVRGPCNTLQMSFNYLTVAYKAQCIIQLQKVADGFTIKVNDIPLWPEIICLSVNGVVEQQAANPRRLIYDVVRYMMITIRCARYKYNICSCFEVIKIKDHALIASLNSMQLVFLTTKRCGIEAE